MCEEVDQHTVESRQITKEFLETALRSKDFAMNITVKDFIIHPRRRDSQSWGNASVSVKVNVEENGREKVHNLFIKLIPEPAIIKNAILVEMKLFLKEQTAYANIIPDMIQYQKNRAIQPFGPSVPNYYYSIASDSKGVVVLDDMRALDYTMADNRKGLNKEHCELVMKELAVFHALSFAIKHKNPERIQEYPYLFHETIAVESLSPYLTRGFDASINLVKASPIDADTIESLDRLLKIDVGKSLTQLVKPAEPYAVICHGDVWCNNMLFKYNHKEGGETPLDVKLLDLQVIRYALPTTDLCYFFFTSTTKETRKKHLKDLLRLYYHTFMSSLERLGIEYPEFTFKVLEKMFKESVLFGVIFAYMLMPVILSSQTERLNVDFDTMTAAELDKLSAEYQSYLTKNEHNAPVMKERLIGTLQDAVGMGAL